MAIIEEKVKCHYQLLGLSNDSNYEDILALNCAKQSDGRLQALLAQWLRMENLVVLTGAGTSVSEGGKTMNHLETEILNTLKEVPRVPKSINAIIEQRLTDIALDSVRKKIGFEEWLSHLVAGHFIGSDSKSPFVNLRWNVGTTVVTQADLAWFVKFIEAAIFAECALRLQDANTNENRTLKAAPHLAFLAKLVARDSNLGRTHLFTLNYDTLIEQACELLGIQYFDGFTGKVDAPFDPSVYNLDIHYPGAISEGRIRRYDKFVYLYKLHGSIHWQFRKNVLHARHPPLKKLSDYRQLDVAAKGKELSKFRTTRAPRGILPTTNKLSQSLNMPYSHLFRCLQSRLSEPQTFLLVLGYGFGDDHVTQILEVALMNPSLVMLVVEPNPSSTTIERVERYKGLGKRVFLLTAKDEIDQTTSVPPATFEDFAHTVLPDVQWLDDYLKLRRFEKQIQT